MVARHPTSARKVRKNIGGEGPDVPIKKAVRVTQPVDDDCQTRQQFEDSLFPSRFNHTDSQVYSEEVE